MHLKDLCKDNNRNYNKLTYINQYYKLLGHEAKSWLILIQTKRFQTKDRQLNIESIK